jgi:penicillin-binding protein-related factor A (putative recombinase)
MNQTVTAAQFLAANQSRAIQGRRTESAILAGANDAQGKVLALFQIPSGVRYGKSEGPGKGPRVIRVKTPFDFGGGFINGPGFFTDAKHMGLKQAGFPVSDRKVCEPHQIAHLAFLADAGHVAGFTIESQRAGRFYWLDARDAAVAQARRDKPIRCDDPRLVDLGERVRPAFPSTVGGAGKMGR